MPKYKITTYDVKDNKEIFEEEDMEGVMDLTNSILKDMAEDITKSFTVSKIYTRYREAR